MKKMLIPLVVLCAAISVPSVASAGWTNIPVAPPLSSFASARACKTGANGPYGPVWNINYQVFRNNAVITAIEARTYRYNTNPPAFVNRGFNNNWLNGTIAGTGGAVGSQLFDDRYFFYVHSGSTFSIFGPVFPGQIANC